MCVCVNGLLAVEAGNQPVIAEVKVNIFIYRLSAAELELKEKETSCGFLDFYIL